MVVDWVLYKKYIRLKYRKDTVFVVKMTFFGSMYRLKVDCVIMISKK